MDSQIGNDLVDWPRVGKQNRQSGEYGCGCCPIRYGHLCSDYPSAELASQETLILLLSQA
jgi:hypothetical protein